jgi:hypothetical protein
MTIHDMTNKSMSRRTFLRISGLAIAAVGALLAGCRPTTTSGTAIESGGEFGTPRTLPTATAVVEQEVASTTAVAASTPVRPQATPTPVARATATPAVQQALGVACPRGLLNDPFPGHCRAYLDRNGNGYCDLSEPGSGKITPRTS